MKKVLFVATVTKHINAFHIPYLRWFKSHGYEVHVASSGKEKIEFCDKHYDIPFQRFPFKLENFNAYKQLKNIISENNYEIIHCHTPVGGVLTRLAAKKSRDKGTKVIYTAHGFHFFKGASIINWLIYYPLEKFLSKYTDCIITMNMEDYDIALKNFKAKKTIYTHGIGLDEDKFDLCLNDKEKKKIREDLGLSINDFILIYVAELSKRKNQDMILNVMSQLKNKSNIKLLLVGNGPYEKKYNDFIRENNMEDTVRLLGYRTDVPSLMQISNIAISTSRQEGLPVNVMEAMKAGITEIVTNCRGNRDLVKNGQNGYIVELNQEKELKEKILNLYENTELVNEMGKNAITMVEPYTLKNVIEELSYVYTNL